MADLIPDVLLGPDLTAVADPPVTPPQRDGLSDYFASEHGLAPGFGLDEPGVADRYVPGVDLKAPAPAQVIVRAATGAPGVVPATTAPEGALPAWAVDAERWVEEHSGGLALGLGAAGLGAGLFMGGGRGLFGGGGSYDPIVQEFLWAE